MRFWTVQSLPVVQQLDLLGSFQPDFRQSSYVKNVPDLAGLYGFVLDCFNRVNALAYPLPGLVFSFGWSDGQSIRGFESYDEFRQFIRSRSAAIGSLWKQLVKNDALVLEIEAGGFNPLPIDINDFQFLMPPVMIMPPYTELSVKRIQYDLYNGQISRSEFPSGLIQFHLPGLIKSSVVNVYKPFDIA